jgi:peptide/nickel transport system substrate-binding protein
MRRIASILFAAASLLAVTKAETRAHYGGTLRVMMQTAPNLAELPSTGSTTEYWDSARVLALLADTLVTVDAADRPHPALATAWQNDSYNKHWLFTIRRGVKFHDGTAATAAAVAPILGERHLDWSVRANADTLTIDSDSPMPSLLAELALPRNAITKHSATSAIIGTGPFRLVEIQPGKLLRLAANEESWAGRPFVDTIEIELNRSLRDQAIALELGRADVIESPLQPSISSGASQRARTSLPIELMALVFSPNSQAQDVRLRDALALAIDRKPIQSALLKGVAEPTASILPNWMTGYSSVFPTQVNVQRAKVVLSDSRQPALTLTYDPRDPQAQLIAERIALNAREAGITIQVSLSGKADITLVRIVLPSPDPLTSLRDAARALGVPQPLIHSNSVDDLYSAERTLLDGHSVIPLFHLPIASAANQRVHNWEPDHIGGWNLSNIWLEADSR